MGFENNKIWISMLDFRRLIGTWYTIMNVFRCTTSFTWMNLQQIICNGHPWRHYAMEILSTSLAFCEGNQPVVGGFHSQRISEEGQWYFPWCHPEYVAEQTIGWLVISGAMNLIWHQYNGTFKIRTLFWVRFPKQYHHMAHYEIHNLRITLLSMFQQMRTMVTYICSSDGWVILHMHLWAKEIVVLTTAELNVSASTS